MKMYDVEDLTGDSYLNPGTPYGDGSGTHQRPIGNIKSISIHHDASPRSHDYDSVARYRSEAAAHYNRLGPGLQYNYKIDNVGTIFKIRPLTTWLYSVGSAENTTCIAICLDGYLHNDGNNLGQDATREQMEALYQLLEELCERHPEFPATWPDVRPHADYSSTACCGNRFTGHIYPIQDKASAQAQLLNQGTYDWPELQPGSNLPTVPAPIPPTLVINYRVYKDGKQIGAYSQDVNAWKKFKVEGDAIKDQNGNDVTAQLRAKFEPPIPTPPVEDQSHDIADLKTRVSTLEALVNKILEFFRGLGK